MDVSLNFLQAQGEQLFSKRSALMSFWQEVAENFYPERADFTGALGIGANFASELMTSYPVLVRRELGNAFGGMLRPTSKAWFHIRASNYERLGTDARRWLEAAEQQQRRLMYARPANFLRATKEGDHDYAAFGQCVVSVELNQAATGILYRAWPLRDVAWCEGAEGDIDTVYRRWRPGARELTRIFPRVHPNVATVADKEPYREIEVWHCVVPSYAYKGTQFKKFPYVSVFIDVENKFELEAVGAFQIPYAIPRWQTLSGSQYAYSPATVVALPDARLLQAMTRVLLDAGEKAVTPPMIAVKEALRSDVNVYAGGITWASAEYDERLGEVLRPLPQDKNGIPVGLELQQDVRSMIKEAFYVNKLTLPPPGQDMTAFEVGQRVQEYIRQALPVFEPTEVEYNGALCEKTFDVALRAGAFGPAQEIPKELRGLEVEFKFESPLHDAIERQKGQTFMETRAMLADAMQIDQTASTLLDAKAALRDVLNGIGTPAKWMRTEPQVKQIEEQIVAAQSQQQQLEQMQAAAGIAKTAAEADRVSGVAA